MGKIKKRGKGEAQAKKGNASPTRTGATTRASSPQKATRSGTRSGSPVIAKKSVPAIMANVADSKEDGEKVGRRESPKRMASPTKAKELGTPTLVSVTLDDPKMASLTSIAKAVATKKPIKGVKKKVTGKKKLIKKKKVNKSASEETAIAGNANSTSPASATDADGTMIHKDPEKGVITVTRTKPKKVKKVVKPKPQSEDVVVKVEPGESGTILIQPPPAKKKKKFFSSTGAPEITITTVGPTVYAQKKEKETFDIYKLYQEMRESNVMSDRWCIPEPMWDPAQSCEVLLCYEVDVLMDGSVRMKRCLKIFEDFELVVLLDGTDKTHIFKDNHPCIRSSQELLDLIRRVTMVKVCSGIKDCDPSDFESLTSKTHERGGSWYSNECNVEVEKGCLGNICKKCTSLRNTLRRKMKRQFAQDSSTTSANTSQNRSLLSNSVKPVLRTVGEALYTNLHHMSGINKFQTAEVHLPQRTEQVLHPELNIYMNSDLKERLDELSANPPPPITKIDHIVEFDPRTNTKTIKRVHTPVLPTSFRNIISGGIRSGSKRKAEQNQTYVMGSNGELTLVQTPQGEAIQLPEGFILADEAGGWGDNVVVQKIDGQDQFIVGDDNNILVGSNFTLEDGEEYEVIGEAASGEGDSIQVLPLADNSDIEIIEVDENMIQLVDENSQPEIQPVDASSDIIKFLQAQSRLHV